MTGDDGGDADEGTRNGSNELSTQLPGIEVTTSLDEADPETLEDVHRRQLEWALAHAEEAKEATRM